MTARGCGPEEPCRECGGSKVVYEHEEAGGCPVSYSHPCGTCCGPDASPAWDGTERREGGWAETDGGGERIAWRPDEGDGGWYWYPDRRKPAVSHEIAHVDDRQGEGK